MGRRNGEGSQCRIRHGSTVRETVGSTGFGGPKTNKPGSSYSMRDIPATTPWDTAMVGHVPMRALFKDVTEHRHRRGVPAMGSGRSIEKTIASIISVGRKQPTSVAQGLGS